MVPVTVTVTVHAESARESAGPRSGTMHVSPPLHWQPGRGNEPAAAPRVSFRWNFFLKNWSDLRLYIHIQM